MPVFRWCSVTSNISCGFWYCKRELNYIRSLLTGYRPSYISLIAPVLVVKKQSLLKLYKPIFCYDVMIASKLMIRGKQDSHHFKALFTEWTLRAVVQAALQTVLTECVSTRRRHRLIEQSRTEIAQPLAFVHCWSLLVYLKTCSQKMHSVHNNKY